ncbi:MAG: Hsp20/alpha crystallin family protein [Thermoleophilia bacterium]|nr:Hsp20/alpha crystallin family protein [Thermoleophilia bacterium]
MSNVTTWDPFRELTALRGEVGRVLGTAARQAAQGSGTWAPPVDVYETADEILVSVELPGMKAGEVEVEFDDHVLAVRGERAFVEPEGEGRFHHLERSYGKFARAITLPTGVRPDRITATFTDGVLAVRVPKAEEVKARKITVESPTPDAR